MTTKKPQDHKPTQKQIDAAKERRFQDVEGHELLKPFSELTAADATRLFGRLKTVLGAEDPAEGTDVDVKDIDFDGMADCIDFVSERYVVDPEGWAVFNTARNMNKVMDLISAYAGELGKDED